MNILSHFSCVKAMDLKFLDFLSFSITQLLEKKYFEYVDPGGHRSSSKSRYILKGLKKILFLTSFQQNCK